MAFIPVAEDKGVSKSLLRESLALIFRELDGKTMITVSAHGKIWKSYVALQVNKPAIPSMLLVKCQLLASSIPLD